MRNQVALLQLVTGVILQTPMRLNSPWYQARSGTTSPTPASSAIPVGKPKKNACACAKSGTKKETVGVGRLMLMVVMAKEATAAVKVSTIGCALLTGAL